MFLLVGGVGVLIAMLPCGDEDVTLVTCCLLV